MCHILFYQHFLKHFLNTKANVIGNLNHLNSDNNFSSLFLTADSASSNLQFQHYKNLHNL